MSSPANIGNPQAVNPTIVNPNAADAVFSQISNCCDQVSALAGKVTDASRVLAEAEKALAEHERQRPVPYPKESGESFMARMRTWQSKKDQLVATRDRAKSDLQSKEQALASKQNELYSLQNTKLPQAQNKDRADLQAQIDNAKKAAEQARGTAGAQLQGVADEDPLKREKNKTLRGPSTPPASGLPTGGGI